MQYLMAVVKPAFVLFATILIYTGPIGFSRADQEGFEQVSAPEVKSMIENGRTVLVHVLTSIEFNMQHIPGSINIPIVEMENTNKLPKDKNTHLVFYCMGKR